MRLSILIGWRSDLAFAALVLCAARMAGCSPHATPGQDTVVPAEGIFPAAAPAAPVPTHRLTIDKAGSVTAVEQGDFIEIRLDEKEPADGIWRRSRQSGDARIESRGEPVLARDKTGIHRVFRFRALGIGRLELAFTFHAPPEAREPRQVVTFRFVVK